MKKNTRKYIVFAMMAFILALTMVLPTFALAESTGAGLPDTPFTWGYLVTNAGAAAVTLLIVQFAKVPLDRVWKIPTRWFVYVLAVIMLVCGTAFTSGITLEQIPIILLNAVVVAMTAFGSYEVTFAKLDARDK